MKKTEEKKLIATIQKNLLDWSSEPVVTTELLAAYLKCPADNLKVNFNNNADRFVAEKDYFRLEGEALKDFRKNCGEISFTHKYDEARCSNDSTADFRNISGLISVSNMTRVLYLWTRWGVFRHVKILNNDRAWEIYEKLVEFYFDHEKFQWNKARVQSKITRRKFTDVLKEFIAYAQKQGTSRPPVAFYAKYSKLINGVVGLKNKKDRDNASPLQLSTVRLVEDKISEIMLQGVKINLPYKDIEVVIDAWTNNFKNPFTLLCS